jgi:predicted secreted protein
MKFRILLFLILAGSGIAPAVQAELQDQGLKSIMDIIDKAIGELAEQAAAESDPVALESALTNATATVVNLSRTLGNLSYSRLQCGQAEVLSEFTQRVQLMPEQSRDPMRDAFQEGFDKSKDETPLLSEDECERLTRSRVRTETVDDTNVVEDKSKSSTTAKKAVDEEPEEVISPEDPKFRHLRVAELSGQLAFKKRFCEDEKVFNRDYNEYLESVPEDYREEVKAIYWKGYKHGQRMNKNLSQEQC